MRYELVIEGNVFYKDGLTKCCIGIEDGQIGAVKKILKGERHLDVGDKLVLPGVLDPHVHFRDPGFTDKEDFATGTLAAAFGGVTTVLDMPNTRPAVTNVSRLKDKFDIIKGKAHVDYGLYCGLGPRTDVGKVAPLASGLKIYLGETTGDMRVEDYSVVGNALSSSAEHGLPVTIHCEDPGCMDRPPMSTKEPRGPVDHDRLRPEEMEVSTVKKVASMEAVSKAKVHLAHVSSLGTLDVLPEGATCEVTPHHMLLSMDTGLKARGKMNPPLRSEGTATGLRTALLQGRIDILASDHAPHTHKEKERPFAEAPAGVPGVETMVPLLLSHVRERSFPIERLVAATSRSTAEIFGLQGKGAILPGMDADIITVDMRVKVNIGHRRLHSRCGWTPFEGHEAIFPKNVFVRGQQLVQDWELVGGTGMGRPVKEGVPGRPAKG